MAGKQVQRRRGTTAQHATFIGAAGEVTVDTNKHVAVVHDGATPGGYPMASLRDVESTNLVLADVSNTANTALSTANTAKASADAATAGLANKANLNGGNVFTGNQFYSGTSPRLLGDLSNSSRALRMLFQTGAGNSPTSVGAIPNGTGGRASFTAYSSPNPDDTYVLEMSAASGGVTTLESYGLGSAAGIYVPFKLNQSGRTGFQLLADGSAYITNTVGGARGRLVLSGADGTLPRYLQVDANGNLQFLGTSGALTHTFGNDGSFSPISQINVPSLYCSGAMTVGGNLNVSGAINAVGLLSSTGDMYTNGYLRAVTGTGGGEAQLYRVRDGAQASTYIRETEVGNTLVITYLIASGLRAVAPAADGSMNSGWALARWAQVFAVAGAINTSDAREKTAVRPFSAEEMAVAQALAGDIGMYQWLSSVEEKGEDGARLHVGVTAQQVQARFEEQGLDASVYGLFCYDEWEAMPEVLGPDDEIVNEAKEAGNRYGVRYDELNQFILRGLLENQRSIETRLAALEAV